MRKLTKSDLIQAVAQLPALTVNGEEYALALLGFAAAHLQECGRSEAQLSEALIVALRNARNASQEEQAALLDAGRARRLATS